MIKIPRRKPLLTSTYLYEYRNAIYRGELVAGRELIIELDKLIREYDNPRYYYDTHDAYLRMEFMEGAIKLTKSPYYGKPMILMLWQKAFIEVIYSYKMSDTGNDRFKKVLLLIARKNTKSETCSGLGLTEGCVGNEGEDIVCSSNDDSQANILYEAIDTMRLMIDPKQKDTWKNQKWIKIKYNGSKIFKLSDRTKNKEGRNIDFAIIDEVHEMKDNVIVKSIEQSQSLKKNPKLILITTEGFVNEGFLDEELKKARRILNDEDDGVSAERYLPWLYTQDSESEVWEGNRENRLWEKSNPTLGMVKQYEYLEEQVDAARKSKADRAFVLSKDFNFKVSNVQAWLEHEKLLQNRVFDLEEFRGKICLGGVDLAETTDMCAAHILLMRPNDKTKYIYSHYWIPQSKLNNSDDKSAGAEYEEWARKGLLTICEDNEVDIASIADWFLDLYKQYEIRLYKCGYDQRFSKEFLNKMDYYGFDCEMVLQNRFVMSSPMKLVETEITNDLINFNDNEITRWCLKNTAMQIWDTGLIMPIKAQGMSNKRIDGAVALIITCEILRRYRSEFMGAL